MTWTELAAEARRHDASMAQGEWSEWEFPDDTDANYRGIAFARNNLARFAEACEKAAGYDALDAERDAWKNAVIDAAVVNWTYTIADDADPRKAVNALICHAIDQDRDRLREENTRLAAELATLRENAGRLADAASPFLLNRHRHEKSNNGDICYLCGEDIRHQCHYLAGESWPSQIEGLRAALAPFAERKDGQP